MRTGSFPPTSNTSDWNQPFYVHINGGYVEWSDDDTVIVGLSPDAISWEDYGHHRSSYPPGRAAMNPPYFRASSADSSGYVTLVSPGLVDIHIPASVMRQFPPGALNCGIRYERPSDSRTSTLFAGRLPILNGVV
jgi:hypothetical protein